MVESAVLPMGVQIERGEQLLLTSSLGYPELRSLWVTYKVSVRGT